ncbi:putative fatty aldehyde dehydrogenase [Apostichopus japonicus]|uniref:Aldehyde dehydrogenase n=1 Tax=Stichopus japonicus TaxID=307972 RepID=A0A2G8JQU5_STIJA|nr:putative fatty aldehyde dehydrogenase [Apostichopus japonicus]
MRQVYKSTNVFLKVVMKARAGFMAGKTRSKESRKRNLEAVVRMINDHTSDMVAAVRKDLNKPSQETTSCETEVAKNEAIEFLRSLDEIMEPEDEKCHLGEQENNFFAMLSIRMSFFCGLDVKEQEWKHMWLKKKLGNAVVLKPSELSPACAEFLQKTLPKYLDPECFPVVNGSADVAQALLKQRFDHILYTGGCNVAKIIMRAAAENLTPVTLELGGKCPAYIDQTADVKAAGRRITWGKFMNAGQTCIAPDYILCDANLKDKLVSEIKNNLRSFYGDDIKASPDYGRIVNERHFEYAVLAPNMLDIQIWSPLVKVLEFFVLQPSSRIQGMLKQCEKKVVFGGSSDRSQRYIEPTLIDNVSFDDAVMGEEIFGPLLPIFTVRSADEAIRIINSREKPLALYVFSNDKRINKRFLAETSSGNITVNETLVHALANVLPFGGVGNSGMGSYHGKFSIDTFSHKKSCLVDPSPKQSEITMGIRYPPYSPTKEKISGFLMRTASASELKMLKLLKYALVVLIMAFGIKVGRSYCL